MAWLKFTAKIPRGYSQSKKEAIANAILNGVVLRTKSGIDVNGNEFVKYTKAYADKKGVGRGDVDLTWTGSMLDSLKVLKIGPDYIDIGYDGRTKDAKKAEGNILGSYGRTPDAEKARDFLGMNESELNAILQSFPQDDTERADSFVLDNVARVARSLSDAQISALERQQLLDSLGLTDVPF